MYQPVEFRDDSDARVMPHIAGVTHSASSSLGKALTSATHLPVLSTDDELLPSGSGLALRSPERGLATVADGQEVLVIFPGPHTYVSPTLYSAETDVPTWNYTAVQLYGRYRRVDQHGLRAILDGSVHPFYGMPTSPGSWTACHNPSSGCRAAA